MAVAAVLLVSACGPDGIGEPRGAAERLAAPNLGGVHVYCVEEEDVRVTPCQVKLDAEGSPTRAQLQDWWLHAAKALREAGTFTYQDQDWRFDWVTVTRIVPDCRKGFGWKCKADAGKSPEEVISAMDRRNPGGSTGIHSASSAHARGCFFAPNPEGYTYRRDSISDATVLRWLIGGALVVVLAIASLVMLVRRKKAVEAGRDRR